MEGVAGMNTAYALALPLRPVRFHPELQLAEGRKVAIVCGFFRPNYTRRLCFGCSPLRGIAGSRLVLCHLLPPIVHLIASADTQLQPPYCRERLEITSRERHRLEGIGL